MDAGEVDPGAERGTGQHRELVRGIDAVHVEAGIGLGVARRLRLGQHDVELAAGFAHGGEDVVAGAVEDAVEPRHAVADQALAQCLDDRDAAGDRCLEGQDGALLLGDGGEVGTVHGQQRLVGGDDMLARTQRALHQTASDAPRTADQLDHHVDVARVSERERIAVPAHAAEVDITFLPGVACAHCHKLECAAAAQRQEAVVFGQQLDHSGADGAEAGDADLQGRFHWSLIRQTALRREP